MSSSLFRDDSDSDDLLVEPPAKKSRHFKPEVDSDSDIEIEENVGGSSIKASLKVEQIKSVDWETKYFGDIVCEAYTTYRSSTFCSLAIGETVTLHRIAPAIVSKSKSHAKVQDAIVRFKNSKSIEVGRIFEDKAKWISHLLDLKLVSFEGKVIQCPSKFQAGDNVLLSLTARISREAFEKLINPSDEKIVEFGEDENVKESDFEKMARERRISLVTLFDFIGMKPIKSSAPVASTSKIFEKVTVKKDKKGKGKQKQEVELDSDGEEVINVDIEVGSTEVEAEGLGVDGEGEIIQASVLEQVYSKAVKNDQALPQKDPPDTFKLSLRPYQKQALFWMASKESDQEGRKLSMHPLWDEYYFPISPSPTSPSDQIQQSFYFNPYSGELSLELPIASEGRCRGGILADEMGLGKTIMVAALLETNTPFNTINTNSASDSRSEKSFATQSKLGTSLSLSKSSIRRRLPPGSSSCTLIIAPVSLLDQWRSELQRSSKQNQVLLYYGTQRKNLMEEIGSGTNVVITSYGTVVSEWKKSQEDSEKGKGKGKAKLKDLVKTDGLFGVTWFRVVLDEAHNIRNRTTAAAKATNSLSAERRWCLTGTPIVNRLEDLYSLLRFVRLLPWGNAGFFRAHITIPFQDKDPIALNTVQVVLESILLRREKSMKDSDGMPIISLPPKHISIDSLTFSEKEQEIYDALFKNAKSKFLGFEKQGTTTKNFTAIFSILMRLRQAVLHPALVLKRLEQNLAEAKRLSGRSKEDRDGDLEEASIAKLIKSYINSKKNLEKNRVRSTVRSDSSMTPSSQIETIELSDSSDEEEEIDLKRGRNEKSRLASDSADSKPMDLTGDIISSSADEKHFGVKRAETSTKLDALIDYLRGVKESDPLAKAVVFSNFTGFLDLIEIAFTEAKFNHLRLDGSLSQPARAKVIEKFTSTKKSSFLLISMKAGGTGLNLVAANIVVIMDYWWNSASEDQATDRIHRFGQTKDVYVKRFLIENSIEAKILKIQERKKLVIGGALSKGEKSKNDMEQDIRAIFDL